MFVCFYQTDTYIVLSPLSWKNNSAGGFRKNISALIPFPKKSFFGIWVPEASWGCFDGGKTLPSSCKAVPACRHGNSALLLRAPGAAGAVVLTLGRSWTLGTQSLCLHLFVVATWFVLFCLHCSCLQLGVMLFGVGLWVGLTYFYVACKADIFSFPCKLWKNLKLLKKKI